MHYRTGSDYFRPTLKHEALLYDIVLIVGASLFIALSAQLAINIPLSPVPITGQTFAVLLTGALLGSRRGSMAIIVYLLEGISGVPVFAGAGFGITHLIGPTGGYLVGFLPAAFLCGWMAERGWDRRILKVFLMMVLGSIVIFFFGLIWLSQFTGPRNVLSMGLFPFIPGALIKIALATFLLPAGMGYLNGRKIEPDV